MRPPCPLLSSMPDNLYDQLVGCLRLETIVPLGPFGLAVRFNITGFTEDTIACEIPHGLPSLQPFTRPSPPLGTVTGEPQLPVHDGAPPIPPDSRPWWTMSLVHSQSPEHLSILLEALPQTALNGQSPEPLLGFQLRASRQFYTSFETMLQEWQALEPGHPLFQDRATKGPAIQDPLSPPFVRHDT